MLLAILSKGEILLLSLFFQDFHIHMSWSKSPLMYFPGDKDSGIYSMFVDMFIWALKSSSTYSQKTWIIITWWNNLTLCVGGNVVLYYPFDEPKWVPEVLMEETAHNVFDKNKRKADTLADSEDKSQGRLDELYENVKGLALMS